MSRVRSEVGKQVGVSVVFLYYLSVIKLFGKFELYHYITSILFTLVHQILFIIFSAFWRMEYLCLAS